jgi:hypothetical protein
VRNEGVEGHERGLKMQSESKWDQPKSYCPRGNKKKDKGPPGGQRKGSQTPTQNFVSTHASWDAILV